MIYLSVFIARARSTIKNLLYQSDGNAQPNWILFAYENTTVRESALYEVALASIA